MMYEVQTRAGRWTIEIRRTNREWEVTIDGRMTAVSVTATGNRWSLLFASPRGGPHDRVSRSYEVSIDRRSNGERIVHVNGRPVRVSIADARVMLARRSGVVAPKDAGPRSITAPMPGRIVKVLVQAGDTVVAHQGLAVIEAMKMENEIRAPRAGRIADVRVTDGISVDGGSVLLVME
jgi:biotin carboxyl carrier protein